MEEMIEESPAYEVSYIGIFSYASFEAILTHKKKYIFFNSHLSVFIQVKPLYHIKSNDIVNNAFHKPHRETDRLQCVVDRKQ